MPGFLDQIFCYCLIGEILDWHANVVSKDEEYSGQWFFFKFVIIFIGFMPQFIQRESCDFKKSVFLWVVIFGAGTTFFSFDFDYMHKRNDVHGKYQLKNL